MKSECDEGVLWNCEKEKKTHAKERKRENRDKNTIFKLSAFTQFTREFLNEFVEGWRSIETNKTEKSICVNIIFTLKIAT